MEHRTILLGAEYDDVLRSALSRVLKAHHAKNPVSNWGVGGSQVLESLILEIDGQPLRIDAETYMGLSISGADELVSKIADAVKTEMESGVTAKHSDDI